MNSKEVRIGNVLLCEDIRHELNGKLILIGVYSADIIVGSFPAAIRLQYYVEFIPDTGGSQSLHFKLSNTAETGEVIVKAELDVVGPDVVVAVDLPNVSVNVNEPSELQLFVSADGNSWRMISSKKVILGEVSGPIVRVNPSPPPP